jgi:hypothetical protein
MTARWYCRKNCAASKCAKKCICRHLAQVETGSAKVFLPHGRRTWTPSDCQAIS